MFQRITWGLCMSMRHARECPFAVTCRWLAKDDKSKCESKNKSGCKTYPKKSKCKKVNAPFPSFSECKKDPKAPKSPSECDCLKLDK